jgi:hypothetical protein
MAAAIKIGCDSGEPGRRWPYLGSFRAPHRHAELSPRSISRLRKRDAERQVELMVEAGVPFDG